MKKEKSCYVAPAVEITEVSLEAGFAASDGSEFNGFGQGGEF